MYFNKNEVNYYVVQQRALDDYNRIIHGKMHNGRCNKMIMDHCMISHYAEQFLIDRCNFGNCYEKYHDLIDPLGHITEIKVYKDYDKLYKQLQRIKNCNWNHSTRFMGFLHNCGNYQLTIDEYI